MSFRGYTQNSDAGRGHNVAERTVEVEGLRVSDKRGGEVYSLLLFGFFES